MKDLGSLLGILFTITYEFLSFNSNDKSNYKYCEDYKNPNIDISINLEENNQFMIKNDENEIGNENLKSVSSKNEVYEDGFSILIAVISHLLKWTEKQSLTINDNSSLNFKHGILSIVENSVINIYELYEKTEKEDAEDYGYSYEEKKKSIGDRGIFYFSDDAGRVLLIRMIRESFLSSCDYNHTFDHNDSKWNSVDDNNDDNSDNKNHDNSDTNDNNNDREFTSNQMNKVITTKKREIKNNYTIIFNTILFLIKKEYSKLMTKRNKRSENVPGTIRVTHVLPQITSTSTENSTKNVPKKIKGVKTFRVVIVADDEDTEEHSAPYMNDGDDDLIPKKKPRITKKCVKVFCNISNLYIFTTSFL